jgi:indolepyruvate ferredoxin oxidoreductase
MVLFQPERHGLPVVHMGAEGAQWIGLAPFTDTRHIFQNLGDGTYSHSGSLAIRAAVLAGVNITYKILLNDAVAMTGGQPVEGRLSAARVVEQLRAEGVARVVVVAEEAQQLGRDNRWPAGIEVRHRDELARVQEELRQISGVTAIVYEQTCAAEKRRRRKNRTYPNPDRRVFINSLVCEGCGDCSVQSNCIAIQPLETELGRKRRIDQSACNKDFSCVKGFCPSFVTVVGARARRVASGETPPSSHDLAEPVVPPMGDRFDMVIAGIGGTGVVTLSAILGMAARLEGFGASLYDMTGLSQKAGQVFSHVRLRPDPQTVVTAQVGPGEAQVVLACDLVAATQRDVLATIAPAKTHVFGNSDLAATADFQTRRDLSIVPEQLFSRLEQAAQATATLIPATVLSEQALGDSIGANLLLLGFAWQRSVIPLPLKSIEQAIRINGKAVEANLKAFAAGRLAAVQKPNSTTAEPTTLQVFIAQRAMDLERYWNAAYAKRYTEFMAAVTRAAGAIEGGAAFAWAAARGAYQLMAYKDEYEVARLYTDGRFRAALEHEFPEFRSFDIQLAPPLLGLLDRRTGRPRKLAFGRWVLPVLRALHALRGLREGPFDIFGRSPDRRLERDLRDAYLAVIGQLAEALSPTRLPRALEVAAAAYEVRGYGHVKAPAAARLHGRLRALAEEMQLRVP